MIAAVNAERYQYANIKDYPYQVREALFFFFSLYARAVAYGIARFARK